MIWHVRTLCPAADPAVNCRPRWAQRQAKDEYMPTRKLPHIMSGIELQMGLDALRESFQPEEDSIAEDPLKPSPFDAGADSDRNPAAATSSASM